MNLSEIIIDKIDREGPISFKDFMEMALYYPKLGYYTSDSKKIGREGDFYTSPVLSDLFGQMIGRQLEEMWMRLGRVPFTIVEYGAGTGALCRDILRHLEKNTPMYDTLQYLIIEKGTGLEKLQRLSLPEKVKWIDDLSEAGSFEGCVLSNEVPDNFAVHLVEMREQLMEVWVDYEDGFTEILKPASTALNDYLAIQNITLPYGYRTEINLEATEWITHIASHLNKGYVLTIDYGYTAKEYYAPNRKLGTLACYFGHTVSDQYFVHIGQQDITSHVNFSALYLWGSKAGLELNGYCNQNYFLRALGLSSVLRNTELATKPESRHTLFEVNKLLLDMGHKFKVLIQQKNLPLQPLTGMQFSVNNL